MQEWQRIFDEQWRQFDEHPLFDPFPEDLYDARREMDVRWRTVQRLVEEAMAYAAPSLATTTQEVWRQAARRCGGDVAKDMIEHAKAQHVRRHPGADEAVFELWKLRRVRARMKEIGKLDHNAPMYEALRGKLRH